jgi:hypothetical protein
MIKKEKYVEKLNEAKIKKATEIKFSIALFSIVMKKKVIIQFYNFTNNILFNFPIEIILICFKFK